MHNLITVRKLIQSFGTSVEMRERPGSLRYAGVRMTAEITCNPTLACIMHYTPGSKFPTEVFADSRAWTHRYQEKKRRLQHSLCYDLGYRLPAHSVNRQFT